MSSEEQPRECLRGISAWVAPCALFRVPGALLTAYSWALQLECSRGAVRVRSTVAWADKASSHGGQICEKSAEIRLCLIRLNVKDQLTELVDTAGL